MRGRTLLVLALLALFQGGVLVWEVRRGEPPPSDEGRLLRLERDRIDRITIQRRDAATVELRRVGAGWQVVRPVKEPADPDAVEALLAAGEFLSSWRAAPAVRAAQLGLDPPVVRVQLSAGVEEQELRVGAADPSREGVYLQTGSATHVVPRSFLEAADRGVDELRDRSLVRLERAQIKRVVREGESPLALERQGRGFWIQAGGVRVAAASEGSERLLGALLALRATRFLPRPPAGTGTAIRIEAGGGTTELRLGGACPGQPAETVVSRRLPGGWAARCVDTEELAPLRAPAEGLQDLALTRAEEPELSRVVIREASTILELRRESGEWQLPDKTPAEQDEIRLWLQALRGVGGRLQRATGEQTYPGSLELHLEEGGRELLRFAPAGEGLRVWREGMTGAVLLVDAEARALLSATPLRFRSRRPWRCSPEEVRSLSVESSGGREEVARRNDGWVARRPAGASLDREALQRLLERLCHLRAGRWLERAGGRPERVLRIELDPEPLEKSAAPRVRQLELLGDPQGCVGRVAGMPAFTLEERDCELLRARLLRTP